MPSLQVSVDQVVKLFQQLNVKERAQVVRDLSQSNRARLDEIREHGEQRMREICQERGFDWNSLSDDQRLEFVDELIHEDRKCR